MIFPRPVWCSSSTTKGGRHWCERCTRWSTGRPRSSWRKCCLLMTTVTKVLLMFLHLWTCSKTCFVQKIWRLSWRTTSSSSTAKCGWSEMQNARASSGQGWEVLRSQGERLLSSWTLTVKSALTGCHLCLVQSTTTGLNTLENSNYPRFELDFLL